MFNRCLLFATFFVFSIFGYALPYAQANLVQVVKLKGTATQLGPGMHEAKVVTMGEWYPKDTSILTGEKSFVLFKYKNGGTLTLGPSSKVVVDETSQKSQAIIALLTGKIKASVKSSETADGASKNKLIVRTHTAALGVRGTSFQTGYNPKSKITWLVTYKGNVALAKIQENKPTAKVEQLLEKKAVLVSKGEYAGVSSNLNVATTPVKIAPEQLTKLKLNETLGATSETVDEKTYQAELQNTLNDLASNDKSKATTVKEKGGTFNQNSGSYTPRPGGLIDTESGLYVPPLKEDEFDQKLKIYKVTTAIGSVDEGGSYRAPEGLNLEAGKGFVIDPNANGKNEELTKLASQLNQNVAGQLVQPVTLPKKKSTLEGEDEDAYERYFKRNN